MRRINKKNKKIRRKALLTSAAAVGVIGAAIGGGGAGYAASYIVEPIQPSFTGQFNDFVQQKVVPELGSFGETVTVKSSDAKNLTAVFKIEGKKTYLVDMTCKGTAAAPTGCQFRLDKSTPAP